MCGSDRELINGRQFWVTSDDSAAVSCGLTTVYLFLDCDILWVLIILLCAGLMSGPDDERMLSFWAGQLFRRQRVLCSQKKEKEMDKRGR